MDHENLGGKSRNADTFAALGALWFEYAATNRHRITNLLKSGQAFPINRIHKQLTESPATIAGTGPTINALEARQFGSYPILSSATALSILFEKDLQPKYAAAVDAGPTLFGKVAPILSYCKDVTLLTHPCVDPQFFELWPGPIALFRPDQAKHFFFQNVLPYMYREIQISFMNVGCVSNGLVEYANYLGYGPLILAGVDFCFSSDRYRAVTYNPTPEGWREAPDEPPPAVGMRVGENGVRTTEEMVAYKLNLYLVMHLDRIKLTRLLPYGVSDTLLYELPSYSEPIYFRESILPMEDYDAAFKSFCDKQELVLMQAKDGSGPMFVTKASLEEAKKRDEKK